MNHQSPRRPRGSLIERAAARFDFVPVPPLAEPVPGAALPTGAAPRDEPAFAAEGAPIREGAAVAAAPVAAPEVPDVPDVSGLIVEAAPGDPPVPVDVVGTDEADLPAAAMPEAEAVVPLDADATRDDAPAGWEAVPLPRFLTPVVEQEDAEVPPLAALHLDHHWDEPEAGADDARPETPDAAVGEAEAQDDDGEVAWSDWGVVAAAAPEPEVADADHEDADAAVVPATAPDADWSPEDAEAAPLAQPRPGTINRAGLAARGMIVPGGGVTPLAEEFRLVKRQLLLAARAMAASAEPHASARARTILVCSARPGEGKTFCAINLALSMAAERDIEVLLVDADFPKPDVLGRLGLRPGPGLLDVLSGVVEDVESCIIRTDVPQLSVLPAGARSDSDTELVASERARALLEALAAADPRRIVIFDSPPALAASPASVLALNVGQVLMVVRADRTAESDLRDAVALLDGCEHIQLLLNAVRYQPSGQRFGSYYGEVEA